MALESGTFINSLNASNPASTDGLGQADDHIRLIKSTLKNTFANVDAAVTATEDELNVLDGVTGVNSNDVNILAGAALAGVTPTEFQYLDGLTGNIQSQINAITTSGGTSNDNSITLAGGNLLETGGTFTLNQNTDETITLNHSTVAKSSTTSSTSSGSFTVVDTITSDAYGHITGVNTKTVTVSGGSGGSANDAPIGFTAGTGISFPSTISFTLNQNVQEQFTINHADTSTLSGTQSTAGQVIKGITVDGLGHVTGVTTAYAGGQGSGLFYGGTVSVSIPSGASYSYVVAATDAADSRSGSGTSNGSVTITKGTSVASGGYYMYSYTSA